MTEKLGIKIPQTDCKKALLVIDVQPAFIKPHNKHILEKIVKLIERVPDDYYDVHVESLFHAEEGSQWDEMQRWTCPFGQETRTATPIAEALVGKRGLVRVLKSTRSIFKGQPSILPILKANNITELHIVGTETNDCVAATAFEAFDLGFAPYIIEECCESATKGLHQLGIKMLRQQKMTNNECLARTIDLGKMK